MSTTRIPSLNIGLSGTDRNDFLAKLYTGIIENIEKMALSQTLKSQLGAGDPTGGSMEFKRFENATVQDYGTARAAGKAGQKKALPVVVRLDQTKEITAEIETFDNRLYGDYGDLVTHEAANQARALVRHLERAFFQTAATAGTTATVNGTPAEQFEQLVLQIETLKNEFIDGVPRDLIRVIMSPARYGQFRNFLNISTNNANVDTAAENFAMYNGVKVFSNHYLPPNINVLAMVQGAVAQPALLLPPKQEEIQLSYAVSVYMAFKYGTGATTPEAIISAA